MNRLRLEFATTGFLAEMRRQWVILHPGQECPVKALKDYPPVERSALMAAVQKAIGMTDTTADKTFEAWQKRRAEENAEAV